MTVIDLPIRRRARPKPRTSTRPVTLPKPVTDDDVSRLHALAVLLDGYPVPDVRMTEQEFHDWCDPDVKAEWVHGEVILMSPESWTQITLAGWLFRVLGAFVEFHDLGEVAGREFMVRFPRQRRRRAPDMLFVSKRRSAIIRDTYIDGAPDLIIEVVSRDSLSRDWREKYWEYERAGVREYWVVDPLSQRVELYRLGKNKRYQLVPEAEGRIASAVLPGFYFRTKWLWQPKLPRVSTVLKELGVRG
jgi:Uma2 family endonuclease